MIKEEQKPVFSDTKRNFWHLNPHFLQHFHANVFRCDNTYHDGKYFTSKYIIWTSIAPYVSNDKEITMPSDVFKRQLRSATIDSVTPENISLQMFIFLSPQIALSFDVMWPLYDGQSYHVQTPNPKSVFCIGFHIY